MGVEIDTGPPTPQNKKFVWTVEAAKAPPRMWSAGLSTCSPEVVPGADHARVKLGPGVTRLGVWEFIAPSCSRRSSPFHSVFRATAIQLTNPRGTVTPRGIAKN